jgi:hypothetical protein
MAALSSRLKDARHWQKIGKLALTPAPSWIG